MSRTKKKDPIKLLNEQAEAIRLLPEKKRIQKYYELFLPLTYQRKYQCGRFYKKPKWEIKEEKKKAKLESYIASIMRVDI